VEEGLTVAFRGSGGYTRRSGSVRGFHVRGHQFQHHVILDPELDDIERPSRQLHGTPPLSGCNALYLLDRSIQGHGGMGGHKW
jgi:hypothetical protein